MSSRALILGSNALARELMGQMMSRPNCGHTVVGMISDEERATVGDLRRLIGVYEPDEIIVADPQGLGCYPIDPLIDAQMRKLARVQSACEFYERLTGKLSLEALNVPAVLFTRQFHPGPVRQGLAHALSVLGAALGLVVCLPLMAVLALLIKLDSRGPVLFVQERCGRNGRTFKLWKFRTMRADLPAKSEWERDNGERITRVGRWLRKYRLDELPQFLNVLRGDMNLVGPRPHPTTSSDLIAIVARNIPEQGEPIPYYSLRLAVRPGMTGWAQIRYKYANGLGEEVEKLRYDLYYIKHYSLLLDLYILVETVRVVLFGHRTVEPAPARRQARPAARTASQALETPLASLSRR